MKKNKKLSALVAGVVMLVVASTAYATWRNFDDGTGKKWWGFFDNEYDTPSDVEDKNQPDPLEQGKLDNTKYDGLYKGYWITGDGGLNPISIHVANGEFNTFVSLIRQIVSPVNGYMGNSTMVINMIGEVKDAGSSAIIFGGGSGFGTNIGPDLSSSLTSINIFGGEISGYTMTLNYQVDTNIVIPEFGTVPQHDQGIVLLYRE